MTKTAKLYDLYKKDRAYVLNNKKRVSQDIPIDYSSLCKLIKKWEAQIKPKHRNDKAASGGGIEAFRRLYDDNFIIPQTIEEGVEKYLRNKNGEPDWMTDREFRESCGVSISKWRRYADEYKFLQVSKNNELFWGHPEIIEEMRKVVQR